jgi:phospholipid/cholesterol/gamma-HCH transport system substrate-binding protein
MSSNKISPEFKVGVLVLVGIVLLFYMSFKLERFGVFRGKGYEVGMVLENASGLDTRSPVYIAGVQVGKIQKISLDGYKALVTLSLKEDVRVPANSKAAIRSQGLLGEKYVEIIPGSDTAFLAAGGRIKEVESARGFDEVFTNIDAAAKTFSETMGEFKGIIGEGEKANIKKSLDNIAAVSGDFRQLVATNKGNITTMVTNLSKVAKDVEEGKGTLGLLVKDETLYNDAKDTVASLKNLTRDVEQGKGTIGKLMTDETLYTDAKDTLKNFKEITDGINKGEGSLGKLMKDDKLYYEAEKTMKKIQKGAEGLQEMTPITILGTLVGIFF